MLNPQHYNELKIIQAQIKLTFTNAFNQEQSITFDKVYGCDVLSIINDFYDLYFCKVLNFVKSNIFSECLISLDYDGESLTEVNLRNF